MAEDVVDGVADYLDQCRAWQTLAQKLLQVEEAVRQDLRRRGWHDLADLLF